MLEPPEAVGWSDGLQCDTQGVSQRVKGVGAKRADDAFQFSPGHFDGVEIWRVGWGETEQHPVLLEELCNDRILVDLQVVPDNDVPFGELGNESVRDPGSKSFGVQRTAKYERGDNRVGAQTGDQSVVLPGAGGYALDYPLASWGAAVAAYERKIYAGFVDENKAFRLPPLEAEPKQSPGFQDVWSLLFEWN